MEIVTDFIFLDSKITVDSDCSHEIKTLASWKKSYDKPRQHIKKQRHHFADLKAMVFTVVIYKCEVGPKRTLSTEELMLSNCGAGEDS